MRFWDTSAIIPLIVQEKETTDLRKIYNERIPMVVWWGTEVEIVSALARIEREVPQDSFAFPTESIRTLKNSWHEILPTGEIRSLSIRLLRVHKLRAAEAQQLAAAIIASSGNTGSLPLICRDEQLTRAARKEGFNVL